MKRSIGLVLGLVLGTACHAQAQSMKAGLWEVSNKMQSGSGDMEKAMADMQKQMAAMPPEQRKMMQDMMAKQGVGMGAGSPGAMTLKVCMTREMLDRNEIATHEGDCKTTYAARSGNTMKVSFTCSKPPSQGEGQVTFLGAEAYSTKMSINTAVNGKTEKITMDGQGKWLSAECGAIKPLPAPKK